MIKRAFLAKKRVAFGLSEVQILGSLIGVGLADTGIADATNLLVSTQQAFSGLDWVPFNVTMADSGATAPDSTATASTLTETAASNQHSISQGLYTAAVAAQYSFAISLKQGLRTRAALTIIDPLSQSNFATCIFDLAGGQIGVAASVGGTFATASATIVAKANGFYLCALKVTTSGSGTYDVAVVADAGSGTGAANLSYGGNTSAAALTIWGAGVWAGAAGTYVPLNANGGAIGSTVQQVFAPNGGTTAYWGTQTPGAYVAFDFGVAAQVTRWRFAPRPSASTIRANNYSPDWATTIAGSLLQTDASAAFSAPATIDTIPAQPGVPYYPRYWLSERKIAGAAPARYVRLKPPSTSFGGVSALQVFALAGTAANACPVQPVISPMGGRFPGLSVIVSITSLTAGALIYYTTDGSTPTTSSTLYAGPFTLSIGGGSTVTVKAIAYLASLSTPTSLVTTSAPFCGYGFHPNDNWYDDKGNLIEAHSGHVDWDPNTSAYYWIGEFQNIGQLATTPTFFVPGGWPAVYLYKSVDLLNWTIVGDILPQVLPGQIVGGRFHWKYNALNNNYVLWSGSQDAFGNSSVYYASTSGSDITKGWTWNATPVMANTAYDFSLFTDSDGVSAYIVWMHSINGALNVQQLNSSYTGLTGSPFVFASSANREGCVLFKYPNSTGGTYFILTTQPVPYNSSAESDLRYVSNTGASPLANSWSGMPGASAWASDPIGTNFNGQPSFVLYPQGKTQPFIGLDFWVPNPTYNSRQVWLPIVVPTSTTMQIQTPATWDPSLLQPALGSSQPKR